MIGGGAVTARLDSALRLVGADAEFLTMNALAGGEIGAMLALPPLARIGRLAWRLGIPVSRRLTFADGEVDLDCWVRARPEADGVLLALSDLRDRPPRRMPAVAPRRAPPPGMDWTWETDAGLRLTVVSAGAGRFGVDVSAVLAQPITDVFTVKDGAPLAELLASGDDLIAVPAQMAPADVPVLLTALRRQDEAGAFAGFVGGIAATAPAAPEPALNAALVAQLDQALRPAIGRIIGRADAMNAQVDGPLDEPYVDYAADIASAGRHLLGLIDDLADLEAIERADFHPAAEPIDLADVARRAAGLLTVRAADAEVRIERPGAEAAVPATGEFRRTLQILVNLVGNAVRYAPRGTAVSVRVAAENGRAVATVEDRGRGIAEADQARIFDKFFRVDPREPAGSGLGLYIARRLARAMGGDLWVESAPGEGARFIFTLPAR